MKSIDEFLIETKSFIILQGVSSNNHKVVVAVAVAEEVNTNHKVGVAVAAVTVAVIVAVAVVIQTNNLQVRRKWQLNDTINFITLNFVLHFEIKTHKDSGGSGYNESHQYGNQGGSSSGSYNGQNQGGSYEQQSMFIRIPSNNSG